MLLSTRVLHQDERFELAEGSHELSDLLLLNEQRNVDNAELVRAVLDVRRLAFSGRSRLLSRWCDVVFGSPDGEALAIGSTSTALPHSDAVHSQRHCRILGSLELKNGILVVARNVCAQTWVVTGHNIQTIQLQIEELNHLFRSSVARNIVDEKTLRLLRVGWLQRRSGGGAGRWAHEGGEARRIHGRSAGSSRKWEHARKLGLLSRDVVISGRFDVPLCHAPGAVENGHEIGQVRGTFTLLSWGRIRLPPFAATKSATISTSPSAVLEIPVAVPSMSTVIVAVPGTIAP